MTEIECAISLISLKNIELSMINKAVRQISSILILIWEIIIHQVRLFKVKTGIPLRVQARIKLVQTSNL